MTSEPTEVAAPPYPGRATTRRGYLVWGGLYLLLALVAGALAALVWVWGTPLPRYLVRDDGSAVMTERGLTEFFATDASFVVIGLIVGVVLGIIAWSWLRRLGWALPLVAGVDALVSALVCWWVGCTVGPGPLKMRLEHAHPGDLVPIQHQLHAHSALAVWPFAAMLPLLVLAALARDPEEGLPVEPLEGRSAPRPAASPVSPSSPSASRRATEAS